MRFTALFPPPPTPMTLILASPPGRHAAGVHRMPFLTRLWYKARTQAMQHCQGVLALATSSCNHWLMAVLQHLAQGRGAAPAGAQREGCELFAGLQCPRSEGLPALRAYPLSRSRSHRLKRSLRPRCQCCAAVSTACKALMLACIAGCHPAVLRAGRFAREAPDASLPAAAAR